jgi:predicted CoA-binding protein
MYIAPSDNQIKSLLAESTTIAVVGMSPKSERPSNSVAVYLMAQGYRVIPVNPGHGEILGLTCYPDLDAIPESVDIIDIFRKSSEVGPVVDQAVDIDARAVWMQLGIINEEAADKALSAGLVTIMDRCLKVEHSRLFF